MSKSKYTPGPWKAYLAAKNEKEFQIFTESSIKNASGCEHIAWANRESNARLIAAAPELLARLEDCAYQLRQAWACIEHIKEHAPDYERKASIETLKAIQMVGNDAEHAIAKATVEDE